MPNAARPSDTVSTTAPNAVRDDDPVIIEPPVVGAEASTVVAAGPSVWRRLLGLAVALPLGAWAGAVAFDLVSTSSSETLWPRAAMWLVIIGLVGALASAVFAMLDLSADPTPSPSARSRALVEARGDVVVISLLVVSLVIRRSMLDEFIDGTPVIAFILAAVGLALALALSWTGRTLLFRTSSVSPVVSVVDLVATPTVDLPHAAVVAAKAKRGAATVPERAATKTATASATTTPDVDTEQPATDVETASESEPADD